MQKKIIWVRNRLKQLSMKLEYSSPIYQVRQKRQNLMDIEQRLNKLIEVILTKKKHQLEIYAEKLEGLSPLKKLSKGYALVVNSNNEVMNRLEKAKVGDMLQISVTDGDVMARVEELIMKERNM